MLIQEAVVAVRLQRDEVVCPVFVSCCGCYGLFKRLRSCLLVGGLVIWTIGSFLYKKKETLFITDLVVRPAGSSR